MPLFVGLTLIHSDDADLQPVAVPVDNISYITRNDDCETMIQLKTGEVLEVQESFADVMDALNQTRRSCT